eukprot:GHVU01110372.1.p1 GENE.GHVU01110372.1~~GHVU01110372.1.p1  ORF type:complete len:685 (+),score=64.12 GHVU01110372.1:260-2314(+)
MASSEQSNFQSDLEEILSCQMCLERCEDPRSLPCLHTFCFTCLDQYIKSSKNTTFPCPSCRNNNTISQKGAEEFPKAFHFNSLCEKIDDLDSTVDKSPVIKCETHKEEIKIYCETCREFLCVICILRGHANHEKDEISEVVKARKNSLQTFLTQMNQRVREYQQRLSANNQTEQDLQAETSSKINTIEEHGQRVIEHVCSLVKRVSDKMKIESQMSITKRKSMCEKMTMDLAQLIDCSKSIEASLKSDDMSIINTDMKEKQRYEALLKGRKDSLRLPKTSIEMELINVKRLSEEDLLGLVWSRTENDTPDEASSGFGHEYASLNQLSRQTDIPASLTNRQTATPASLTIRQTATSANLTDRQTATPRSLTNRETAPPASLTIRQTAMSANLTGIQTATSASMTDRQTATPRSLTNRQSAPPASLTSRQTHTPASLTGRQTATPASLTSRPTATPASLTSRQTATPASLTNRLTATPASLTNRQTATPASLTSRPTATPVNLTHRQTDMLASLTRIASSSTINLQNSLERMNQRMREYSQHPSAIDQQSEEPMAKKTRTNPVPKVDIWNNDRGISIADCATDGSYVTLLYTRSIGSTYMFSTDWTLTRNIDGEDKISFNLPPIMFWSGKQCKLFAEGQKRACVWSPTDIDVGCDLPTWGTGTTVITTLTCEGQKCATHNMWTRFS